MTGYDVVVVGGGAAGAVLAARLSEDPGRRVLLLEAGPVPRTLASVPSALLDAGRVPGARADDPLSWWYPAELAPGRDWTVSRGRVAGGSTSTNGAYFVRPRRADLDRWSAHGDESWSWDRVLPVLRSLERDLDLGGSPEHGDAGPVPVRRSRLDHAWAAAFTAASLDAGHTDEPDKNAEGAPGIGPVPSNAAGGVRWSTALTHLLPAVGRPNLDVRGGSVVTRVLVVNQRATGVEVRTTTGTGTIPADEVVLAAGALASPVLLLRSGIGPAGELRSVGIAPVVDAPGVGTAFGDHPQVTVEWLPTRAAPRPIGTWMGGMLTAASSGGAASGDLEVLQSLRPMAELTGGTAPALAPLPLLVSVHAPEPGGRIVLASADPAAPAVIRFGYLRTADARRRLREGVRVAVGVTERMRAAGDSTGLVDPPPVDDQGLDGWIRARLATALHTCATVPFRMPDGSPGPVDQVGRTRGVEGLRVADCSILPTAPLRGPAVAAVLTGELVAAAMRATV